MKTASAIALTLILCVACNSPTSNSPTPLDSPESSDVASDTSHLSINSPDWNTFSQKKKSGLKEPLNTQATGMTLYPSHRGDSPYSFDTFGPPSDSYIVTDSRVDGDVDSYRSRSDGPLEIPLDIQRNVGNLQKLIANDLISSTAKLILPSYDVDEATFPSYDCDGDDIDDALQNEVDIVSFNGQELGRLTGGDGTWAQNTFDIPIDLINFPSSPGQSVSNVVSIEIDAANKDVVLSSGAVGCESWAVEVDWVGIQFEITSPIAYVPGTNDDIVKAFLGLFNGLKSEVKSIGLNDYKVDLNAFGVGCFKTPGASLREASKKINNQLIRQAESLGTDAFHLISYSKGGPNSRQYINDMLNEPVHVQVGTMGGTPVLRELEVASFATMGGTYLGTPLADFAVFSAPILSIAQDETCDQITTVMPDLMQGLVTPPMPTLAGGGDADANSNGKVDSSEAGGFGLPTFVVNGFYQIIKDNAAFTLGTGPAGTTYAIPEPLPEGVVQKNDATTPLRSALALPGSKELTYNDKNHVTIIRDTAADIVNAGVSGSLSWRLK